MRFSNPSDWHKFEVARLGVDPAVFSPRPPREHPDPFDIVCVGRLAPVKGHLVLIRAIDQLARDGGRVRLRIVGGGDLRAALEAEVRSLRACPVTSSSEGSLNQDRVIDLYRQADAFAPASFAEGVPVVLMEAMSMEIPCVATWVNGVPELIRDGDDGLLVALSDADGLAAAIKLLIDHPGPSTPHRSERPRTRNGTLQPARQRRAPRRDLPPLSGITSRVCSHIEAHCVGLGKK